LRQVAGGGEAVTQNRLGKRAKAAFAGDFRAGPSLRFIGQIEVFELGLAVDRGDLRGKLFGQFALVTNRFDDGFATRLELAPIDQSFSQ
jgi:hypothetical protein